MKYASQALLALVLLLADVLGSHPWADSRTRGMAC
jgi:hypothetical protein